MTGSFSSASEPHDRMVAVAVGEHDLGAHLRQGVGRIDHDVVAELDPVLVGEAPEPEVGRRRARSRAARDRAGSGRGPPPARYSVEGAGLGSEKRGLRARRPRRRPRRPGGLSLPSDVPRRDGHVVALEHLLDLGIAAAPLARVQRRLAVALSRKRSSAASSSVTDRIAEVKASSPLNALSDGAPPCPHAREVEVGELVLRRRTSCGRPSGRRRCSARTPADSLMRASARAGLRSGSRYSTSIFGESAW